jgi:hypothetical protein
MNIGKILFFESLKFKKFYKDYYNPSFLRGKLKKNHFKTKKIGKKLPPFFYTLNFFLIKNKSDLIELVKWNSSYLIINWEVNNFKNYLRSKYFSLIINGQFFFKNLRDKKISKKKELFIKKFGKKTSQSHLIFFFNQYEYSNFNINQKRLFFFLSRTSNKISIHLKKSYNLFFYPNPKI